MSLGNPRRLSGGTHKKGPGPRRSALQGERVGRRGSLEPPQFEKYNRRELGQDDAAQLANIAIAAIKIQTYFAENYGHPLTLEEACDIAEGELKEFEETPEV